MEKEWSLSDKVTQYGTHIPTRCVKKFINNRLLWIDRILKQYAVGEKSGTFHTQIIKDFKAERKRLIEEAGDKLI